jgi:hypothetical protein
LKLKLKAVTVTGSEGDGYAIIANIEYNDGSTDVVTTPFSTGTHDYERELTTFTPEKPIKSVTVSCVLNVNGTAFFEYVSLQEKIGGL